jgi:hypothetical protein
MEGVGRGEREKGGKTRLEEARAGRGGREGVGWSDGCRRGDSEYESEG